MTATIHVQWVQVPATIQSAFEGWLSGWGLEEMYLVATSKEDGDLMYHGTIVVPEGEDGWVYGLDCWINGAGLQINRVDLDPEDASDVFNQNLININADPRQMPFINGG